MSDQALEKTYDDAPYESHAHPFSHPSRLAALARLAGLESPDVRTGRVLEVGCATGINLLSMSMTLPEAQLLGIDFSRRQIEQARTWADAIGRRNCRFEQVNLRDLGDDAGEFDFIVAHGVFSWVAPDMQENLLALCARRLSPNGVAMVSFNTYPGWFARGMLRELMNLHTRGVEDQAARAAGAKEAIDELREWLAPQQTPFAQLINRELEAAKEWDPRYILHDYLELENHPVYFHDFVARARARGLEYLRDAEPGTAGLEALPPEARTSLRLRTSDPIELEQWADVFRKQSLRRAMLFRPRAGGAGVGGAAAAAPDRRLRPERMSGLHIAAPLKPLAGGSGASFTFEQGLQEKEVHVSDPATAAALRRLASTWPRTVPFDSLARDAGAGAGTARDALAGSLIGLLIGGGAEVHAQPSAFVTEVSDRPRASPLAQLQLADGHRAVATLRSESIPLDDGQRRVLMLLDGTMTHAQLVERVACDLERDPAALAAAGATSATGAQLRAALDSGVKRALADLAAAGLLMA